MTQGRCPSLALPARLSALAIWFGFGGSGAGHPATQLSITEGRVAWPSTARDPAVLRTWIRECHALLGSASVKPRTASRRAKAMAKRSGKGRRREREKCEDG
jgi:hypothetical protein